MATVADTKTGTSAIWARPNLKPWVTEPDKIILYDGILAFKSDRLSRAAWVDEIQIRLWAQEHGKELFIVSPELHWPPSNQAEQLSWEIFASQAHEEWKNTSERYQRMQRFLRAQGKLVGRPPFGYDSVPAEDGHKVIEPNELGRRYIPEMFARCIAGESSATITRWLNQEGVQPPNSDAWNARSVLNILRCPTYAGRRCQQDPKTKRYGRVILRCEPLVDNATFRRAQEAIDSRPRRGPMRNADKALLAGILYCANCGAPMYRRSKPGGRLTPRYHCNGTYPERKSSCKLSVTCEALDDALADWMINLNLQIMKQEVIPGRDYADEISEVEQDIADLAVADLDDDEFDAKMAGLRAERKRLKNLPRDPDRVDLVPDSETYAQRYARLSPRERGIWLRASGVRVHASRDVGKVMKLLSDSRKTDPSRVFPHGLINAGDVYAALIINKLV